MRFLYGAALLAVFMLSGCGGGGGGSAPSSTISGSSGGGSSSSGSGSSGAFSSSGSSGASSSSSSSSSGTNNVVAISVNLGPAAANGGTLNIPYASVTVCNPGTSTCATVNDVLVDTGSYGLRLMASALTSAGLTPSDLADPSTAGNTLAECLPFADGYTWGPLATLDVRIGGELASAITVNIINDNGSYAPAAPSGCTGSGGTSLNSVSAFVANGVLGVGVFDSDCGYYCTFVNSNDIYYSCSSANSCSLAAVTETLQVRNPVAKFAADNNGVVVKLPSISAAGAVSAAGSLIFGINTQSNNALGSATVLTGDGNGDIMTSFNGSSGLRGFIDSGSNALFFNDSAITQCGSNAQGFYCPTSTLNLSATNMGLNGSTSTVSFSIANLNHLSASNYAFDDVGGSAGSITGLSTSYFDWGMPFFYGRTIYFGIEGQSVGGNTGPFFAY